MKGGGTAKALESMMQEFGVQVCGTGVIVATQEPRVKRVQEYYTADDTRHRRRRSRFCGFRPPTGSRQKADLFSLQSITRKCMIYKCGA
jgi:hypothetical protein